MYQYSICSCTQVFKQYNHNEQKTQNSTYIVYTYLYVILKKCCSLTFNDLGCRNTITETQ